MDSKPIILMSYDIDSFCRIIKHTHRKNTIGLFYIDYRYIPTGYLIRPIKSCLFSSDKLYIDL